MGHSWPLFLYFRLFNTVDSKLIFYMNVLWWLDKYREPLVLEATSLPNEPQPLPNYRLIQLPKLTLNVPSQRSFGYFSQCSTSAFDRHRLLQMLFDMENNLPSFTSLLPFSILLKLAENHLQSKFTVFYDEPRVDFQQFVIRFGAKRKFFTVEDRSAGATSNVDGNYISFYFRNQERREWNLLIGVVVLWSNTYTIRLIGLFFFNLFSRITLINFVYIISK